MEEPLENRVALLEAEIQAIKQRLPQPKNPADALPWWEEIFGAFKNDPLFDEAMRLGEDYRKSQRPNETGHAQPARF